MKQLIPILVLCFFLFQACTQTTKSSNSSVNDSLEEDVVVSEDGSSIIVPVSSVSKTIDQPLPNITPKPTTYKITPSIENVLITDAGTTITIPKDAFVDQKGNPIKGEIEVDFQEYHTAADVILSGIPMHVTTEDGSLEAFETAGMFDIAGKDTKGNEVRIANNKTIKIDLATYKEEEDFNFYSYNKTSGLWKEEYKNTAVASNSARTQLTEKLSFFPIPEKPIEIKKASSNDFVFELAVDKNRNVELSQFDDVLWKLNDNTIEDAQLFKQTIQDPNLTCIDREHSVFQLSGKVGTRKVQTKVQPVLFGSNWKKAQASFNKKVTAYKQGLENKAEMERRLDKMATFQRSLKVSAFGIYNCDRYLRMKGRKKITFRAVLVLPVLQKIIKRAFLIIKKKGQNNAVPVYTGGNGTFIYAPHEDNTLIGFDDDGNIFEFKNEKFKLLTAQRPVEDSEQTLNLDQTQYKATSPRDIQAYIDQL
jgi:hypothetical protein